MTGVAGAPHNQEASGHLVGEILEGLGIPAEVHGNELSTLSGGFKLRVLLAQVLASKPQALLLDEPTNHLDILSIRWLEKFLVDYAGTAVVISHDHRFLDNVCNYIVDVDYRTILLYGGNYQAFVTAKQAERERIKAEKAAERERIRAEKAAAKKARYARYTDPNYPILQVVEYFRPGAVIQRDKPIRIWGWAEPGGTVSVRFGDGRAEATAGDGKGAWEVTFPARGADARPRALSVRCGDQAVEMEDIVIGDVWVMNGQSNMAFGLGKTTQADLESVQAHLPLLRQRRQAGADIAIADLDSNGLFNDVELDVFKGDRFFVDLEGDRRPPWVRPQVTALAEVVVAGDPVLLGCVGGVLAGAIFGDHCSPISDTTILSSMASGCDHIAHVRTQMPYAVAIGALAMALGNIGPGLGDIIGPSGNFATLMTGAWIGLVTWN